MLTWPLSLLAAAIGIVEYINDLLSFISDMALWNKAERDLSDHDGFSSLYYKVFHRNRHSIPPVKAGIHRGCHQRLAIYNFLQRLHVISPKSIAARVLDSDLLGGSRCQMILLTRIFYGNGNQYSNAAVLRTWLETILAYR